MADVDQLLKQYIAEHRAGGEANPRAYLDQVEGTDRAELAALIDAYLARSPGQPWDEDAYRGSPAERLVESLHESLAGASGSWPVLLPELRNRARIKREELVERLAAALGVAGREEKVAYYYNQMEHGRLRRRRLRPGARGAGRDRRHDQGGAAAGGPGHRSQRRTRRPCSPARPLRRRPSTRSRPAWPARARAPAPQGAKQSATRSTSSSSAAEPRVRRVRALDSTPDEGAATRPGAGLSLRSGARLAARLAPCRGSPSSAADAKRLACELDRFAGAPVPDRSRPCDSRLGARAARSRNRGRA